MATKLSSQERKAYQQTVITPATLQRVIAEIRGELTDKDIFLSSAYHQQLSSLGAYLVGRTGRKNIALKTRVVWDESDAPITAFTDNKEVVINAAFSVIQKQERRPDRNMCIMGMACHEFAHCFFTDFKLLKKQYETFMGGKLYPNEPKETPANANGLKGIKEVLSRGKGSRNMIANLYKRLDNSIEDGYIERSISLMHPGDTKKSLKLLNVAMFGGSYMDNVKEVAAKDPDCFNRKWSIFSDALLTLIKLGTVDIDPAFNDVMKEINGRISALAPRMMRELENSNVLSRKELALDIILENWDFIEEEAESSSDSEGNSMSDLTDDQINDILRAITDAILNGMGEEHDQMGNPNSGNPIKVFIELPSPSQEQDDESNESGDSSGDDAGDEAGDDTGDDAGDDTGDDAGNDTGDDTGDDAGDEASDDTGDDAGGGKGQQDGDGQQGEPDKGGSSSQNDSGEDNGAEDQDGSEDSGNPQNGQSGVSITISITPDDDKTRGDGSMQKSLNDTETEIAKESAQKKVDEQLHNTLQNNANQSASDDDWNVNIQRIVEVPSVGVYRYNNVWPKISPISKMLKKELLKLFQERRRGSKQTGLIHGRRLDTRNLYRSDEKYFSKNQTPSDRPTVATALLIDQSGSMASCANDNSGINLFTDKIEAASNAAVLLYDFCVELGFPIMVAGHSTNFELRNSANVDVMASFQKVDKNDRYRICAASADEGNRDGTALNYMLSELKHRSEEVKLLFIISDGQPSAYRSNEEGIAHLKEVIADAQRSGVLVFAAALDEDIPHLAEIYGDTMFEFTDLARMPKTLLNVMKRYMK